MPKLDLDGEEMVKIADEYTNDGLASSFTMPNCNEQGFVPINEPNSSMMSEIKMSPDLKQHQHVLSMEFKKPTLSSVEDSLAQEHHLQNTRIPAKTITQSVEEPKHLMQVDQASLQEFEVKNQLSCFKREDESALVRQNLQF